MEPLQYVTNLAHEFWTIEALFYVSSVVIALLLFNQLKRSIMNLADAIADLQSKVAAETSAVESAKTLINGFNDRLNAAIESATAAGATADQLAELQSLSDTMKAETDGLASAVAANTPAAPTS